MKLSDFEYDASSGVYISSAEIKQIDYLDGSERYLHDVLMSSHDLDLYSPEIKAKIKNWPSLYHLSPYRPTIIDCFDFQNKEATILELGAGCGAITCWLGDHFRDVHAVEGSFQRAYIARLRCRGLSSLKVYAANFFDLDLDKQFDIVTLIGVLEYSHLYHPVHREKPHEAALSTLQLIHRGIKDQGILLLAIEDKLGLKYFSGAKEDHSGKLFDGIQGYPAAQSPVTFSAAELDQLLQRAGFTAIDFYLPFPDYKLARTIINAQALSTHHHYLYNWIETPFPDRSIEQRTLLFNESLALREISKAGLLKDLSNSFLIVAHKGEKDVNYRNLGFSDSAWIARHYSLNRHRTFCKRATLLQTDSGSLYVDNRNVFHTALNERPSSSFFAHTFSSEQFCPGDLLLFSIFEMLVSGTFIKMFPPLLEQFQKFLLDNFSTGKRDEDGMPFLSGDALDVAFWNIIREKKSGDWIFIDREWIFHGIIPIDFIVCRNLNHLFVRYRAYFDKEDQYAGKSAAEMTLETMQKMYPIYNRDRFMTAMQLDKSFQNFVNNGASYQETLSVPAKLCQQSVLSEDTFQKTKDKSTPPVSVVIPVFNRVEYTQKCLEALSQYTPGELYEIIIIDNASTDGTREFLNTFESNIRIITNRENLGFAKACNQGVRASKGRYVLLLNNDTIPQPGWLESMLSEAESDEKIAIVGSCLLYPEHNTIQHIGVTVGNSNGLLYPYHIHRFKRLERVPDAHRSKDYQAVTGACMLIRRKIFDRIGLFDEQFINGYEDIDFCFRVIQAGYRIRYCHRSRVYHYESITPYRHAYDGANLRFLNTKWIGKIQPDENQEKTMHDMSEILIREKVQNNPYDIESIQNLIALCELRGDYEETSEWREQLKKLMQSDHTEDSRKQTQARTKDKQTIDILVSIVIPVYNNVKFTQKCINLVYQTCKLIPFEIIVVDNASTDTTRIFLEQQQTAERLKPIFNSENLGFTKACNQGAKIAKGTYVIFLNNDTEPQPAWLDNLVELAESDLKVGIVGAKLIYPDGRLQEAGGIIFSDGSGWNYGRFNNPQKPAYNFEREVDYVSGACLLIRASLLKEVDYLDEQYSPGYYEDTDLCFRVRSLGYKVIYNPFSVVIHHEGVSSGTDLTQGMKKFQNVNKEKFVNKWKGVLQRQYPPHSKNIIPASERNVKGNILIIDPYLPWFDRASGSLRLFTIITILKEHGYHITYIARDGRNQQFYAEILRKKGVEVYATDPKKLEYLGYKVDAKEIDLREILTTRFYDIAYLSFYKIALQYLFEIRRYSPQTKIIIDTVDIHFVREMRLAELENNKILYEKAERIKKNELSIYSKADALITITEDDWNQIKDYLPHKKYFVIPNIHTINKGHISTDGRTGLLFVGNFVHPPNVDAVKYFVKDILPLIKKALPETTLTVVGNNPPKDILDLQKDHVIFTGYIPSTEPYLQRARVSIAPLRYGSGLKGKIGEAMAHGLPVVTTSIGAEGFGIISGQHAIVADSPKEFADAVITLCSDDNLWLKIASHGKAFIQEHYSPQKVTGQLQEMLADIIVSKPMELTVENKRYFLSEGEESIQTPTFQKGEATKGLTSIVILTFNQLRYTKECVESIRKYTPESHEIIFVDNGSTDGTVKWLKEIVAENPHYTFIENKKNLGFAKGCNQGILASSGEYVLLLNNDVVVTEEWLSGMLECFNSAPDIGIAGPMTNNISGPQKVPNVDYKSIDCLDDYAKLFREKNRYRRVTIAPIIRRIVGFCLLFRRQVAEIIGLLDERFGSGNFEDHDFCLRASLEGYRCVIAGDVFIHHYGSRSFVGNNIDYNSAMARNRKLFMDKWKGVDVDSSTWKKLWNLNALAMSDKLSQEGNIHEAIAFLREGLKHSPDDNQLKYAFAEICIKNKNFKDAVDILETMPEELKLEPEWFEFMGYCKEGMEIFEDADRYADEALRFNTESPKALMLKGLIAYKKEAYTEAEIFFKKALEADKGFGEAYVNLGALKWLANDKEEALNLFEKAFILTPTDDGIVHNYYAIVGSLSRLERSEKVFQEAIGLYPSNKKLKYMFVDLLLQEEKYEEAMNIFEEAMLTFGVNDDILALALGIRDKVGTKDVDRTTQDSISLCMIAKNEENNIARCLMSMKQVVAEMIVVDTGSTDRTKDIAKAFGAKIFDFKWTNNFSDARNFSLSKASCKWILVLDADEVISSTDHTLLKETVKKAGSKPVAYSFITRNYIIEVNVGWTANDGRYEEEAGPGWFPSDKVRLFPNNRQIRFENPVHEFVEPSLKRARIKIKKSCIPVHHYGKLNKERSVSKGEEYYHLGKIKLAEKGELDLSAVDELAVQAAALGKYEEALEHWKKAIELDPNFIKAFHGMGNAYFQLGRYEDALLSLKRTLQLAPHSKDTTILYANCEICTGNVESAINLLEELSRKDPKYPKTMVALSIAYFCAGRKEKGLEYVNGLRDMHFICADYFSDFAKKLISSQKFDNAIQVLEAAVESNNVNDDTSVLLAECYKIRQVNESAHINKSKI